MDNIVFQVIDKSRRSIKLTKKQWSHIREDHPEVKDEEPVIETLKKPDKITQPYEGQKHYYYKYYKHRKPPDNYKIIIYKDTMFFILVFF